MIVLFKCNYEALPLHSNDDNGGHSVTNERALWAKTPLPVRPLSLSQKGAPHSISLFYFQRGCGQRHEC